MSLKEFSLAVVTNGGFTADATLAAVAGKVQTIDRGQLRDLLNKYPVEMADVLEAESGRLSSLDS